MQEKALKGIEPKIEVLNYLRRVIERRTHGFGTLVATRELNRIQKLKKGVTDMSKEDKKVYVVFREGQKIRENYLRASDNRATSSDGEYTASGDKKIYSIAYRLLNATKAGNKEGFMDTLFRIHMTAGEQVSSIFLNALHEKDLKFETVASAFISGLLSPRETNKQEAISNG